MKKLLYGLGTFFLFAILVISFGRFTHAQQQQVDLVAVKLKLKPAIPEAGATVMIRAFVANQGSEDVNDAFDVALEIDGEVTEQRAITRLGVNQMRAVEFPWLATIGAHKIRVLVDEPFSSVREATKENNRLSLEITIAAPATVRSATRQIAEAFGEALEESGKALKFELSGDALKVYSDTLNALTNSANALREVVEDIQIIKNLLPPALAQQQEQLQRADAIVFFYDTMAEITLRMMGALSLGNFDGIIEQAGMLRAKMIELSTMAFEGLTFAGLKPAIAQLDKIIPLAKEFKEAFGGAKGRDLATVGRELFESFLNYGLALAQAGQGLKQAAAQQSANFMDSMGNPVVAYFAGNRLIVTAANAHRFKLALLDANGQTLREVESVSDKLEFDGLDSAGNVLQPGTYFYKLTIQNTVIVTNELGRLIVSTQ